VDDLGSVGDGVEPKPCAGKEGTTIQVQDLFHNIPSRRRAMEGRRNEREEYERILNVVQRYAVHASRRGVGFLCRGGKKGVDLNTQSLGSVKRLGEKRKREDSSSYDSFGEDEVAAAKDVVGHVFGSDVIRELLPLRAGEGDVNAVSLAALKAMAGLNNDGSNNDENEESPKTEENNKQLLEDMMMDVSEGLANNNSTAPTSQEFESNKPLSNSQFSFAYNATGLITNGSYSTPKSSTGFLLFINDRLVESPSLRRAVESVYADTLPKGGKPFVYLSLELPGPHVDVNVHPTKKEVALLHEERLCDALMAAVREVIGSATSSRTFVVAGSKLLRDDTKKERVQSVLSQKQEIDASTKQNDAAKSEDSSTDLKRKLDSTTDKPLSTKKPYDPSRLVRTNRAALAGALEPFLVKKDVMTESEAKSSKNNAQLHGSFVHEDGCSLANKSAPDLSLPGAFATAICRCQIQGAESLPRPSNPFTVRNNPVTIIRPKKVTRTECDYKSITTLRNDVSARNHQSLNESLRQSTYVGAISRTRSLIQSGLDLLMINHKQISQEMFYQLTLLQFKGLKMAELGGSGVDVMEVMGHYLQACETEDLEGSSHLKVSKNNTILARQYTSCLAEKSMMLLEYFSIKLEWRHVNQRKSLFLTGLPIVLEGHCPQPYALPLFLIRLATEVNWTSELPCFQGICTEIGSYYAELPLTDSEQNSTPDSANKSIELVEDETKSYIKHMLFPAFSYLCIPPKDFVENETIVRLANLNSLYKVFERC
jgi:DNA mismatch repair protein MLH1